MLEKYIQRWSACQISGRRPGSVRQQGEFENGVVIGARSGTEEGGPQPDADRRIRKPDGSTSASDHTLIETPVLGNDSRLVELLHRQAPACFAHSLS